MGKKGYTLIEVLAVIVLLGIIAGIAYPNISRNYAKRWKSDLYNSQIDGIIDAAQTYVTDNINNISCSESGANTDITLGTLQEKGYIDEDIKSSKTGDLIEKSSKVVVTCKMTNGNYKYSYKFVE